MTPARKLRQEKALAVVKGLVRAPIAPVPASVVLPDQTYTFWGYPNEMAPDSIVYFMYSAGRVKIGFSRGLRVRHNELKKAGPFPPIALLILRGGEEMEREFHRRFDEDRLHGEWFALSPNIRNFLNVRLCDRGLASFQQAEADFLSYCERQMADLEREMRDVQ